MGLKISQMPVQRLSSNHLTTFKLTSIQSSMKFSAKKRVKKSKMTEKSMLKRKRPIPSREPKKVEMDTGRDF